MSTNIRAGEQQAADILKLAASVGSPAVKSVDRGIAVRNAKEIENEKALRDVAVAKAAKGNTASPLRRK